MHKLPDWRQRLTAYLLACREKPFVYGEHDCGLFAGGAVFAMTGQDVTASVRGLYASRFGAARVMRGSDEAAFRCVVSAALGEPIPRSVDYQGGDVVLAGLPHSGPAPTVGLGVAVSDVVAFVGKPSGLVLTIPEDVRAVWRV